MSNKTTEELRDFIHQSLFTDLMTEEVFPQKTPLLAHYTSIKNIELILSSNEIWFANPLYMNDLQELRFGILEGARLFLENNNIKEACGSDKRYKILKDEFNYYFNEFESNEAFDVYIFCLSEHDPKNTDGLLSMWRGYGSNGSGAALVIDTKEISNDDENPFLIAKVEYSSTQDRLDWLQNKFNEFAELLTSLDIADNHLHCAAWALFQRIKIFSLFTKHHGFSEEREWRIAYLKDRDPKNLLKPMFHYFVGDRGIEPKLKLKIAPAEGVTQADISFEKLTNKIILGPTTSSKLAETAFLRMLEIINRESLKSKVIASDIPFRTQYKY